MGIPGTKPKPSELKKLAGNPGRRPLNEQEPQPAMANPKMPRGRLPKEGQRLWKALAEPLARMGVLTEFDLPAFEMLCLHYSLARDAFEIVNTLGLFVKDRDGQPRKNPAMQLFRDNSASYRAYLTEFGLTPSSRVRIKAIGQIDERSLADILFDGIDDG